MAVDVKAVPTLAEREATGQRLLAEARMLVAGFETRFEMTSDEMRRRLNACEIVETVDVGDWLMALDLIAMIERGG